ncbi:MAG: hypothetical protein DCE90_15195 [Pseudanabaena sp.]|nr:MAG: hypothetical protein DCE90_15195 [Pseudanabaena sp.]
MDEASIVSALQDDLKDYKVKTQIRRRDSQLHVLVTRDENAEFDYNSLYSIVKRRVDELAIAGARELVVYGRLAGARHPEWQKSAEIKPPLPLIELDLEELEEIGKELGNLAIAVEEDETSLQDDSLETKFSNEYSSLKASLEDDLRTAGELTNQGESPELTSLEDFNSELEELNNDQGTNNDLNLEDLDLDSLAISNGEVDSFETIGEVIGNMQLPKPSHDAEFDLHSPDFNSFSVVTIEPPTFKAPVKSQDSTDEDLGDDFSIDAPTIVNSRPLPPPPPTKRKTTSKVVEPKPQPMKLATPIRINTVSLALSIVMVSILGLCAWLVWDRSVQQQYLADARDLENLNLDPQKIQNLSLLADTRNRIQSAVAQLELIPDRPASLYAEAQVEIKNLKPKLAAFDRRVTIEYAANNNLELAKTNTLDAALMVQNPPHTSKVWKAAQAKRQEAIQALSLISPDSAVYAQAQTRLKTYRAELVQISKWVDIQVRAESIASDVNPAIATQIQQLKSDPSGKENFLKRCSTILQPEISSNDAQRLGLTINNLTSYLCAYYWDS